MQFKYKHAILGGTFDRLHIGHKHFIEAAEKASERVTIGLVTDEFLGNRLHKNVIEPYKVREKELRIYLKSKSYDRKTTIYPLSDIFGPALKDPNIDIVLAIDESLENAKLINLERAKKRFFRLEILVVPMLKAKDGGLISSKRIRGGEIDRNGNSYILLFANDLKLPEKLRSELRKPFGKILETLNDYKKVSDTNPFIVAIGDIVVSNLIKAGSQANVSIIDFKTQRQPIKDKNVLKFLPRADIKAQNEPSTIEKGAVEIFNSMLRESILKNEKHTIEIKGEEDLLTIPAILLSPLGTIVLYGMPDIGGIAVEVTEEKKNQIKRVLDKFDILNLE